MKFLYILVPVLLLALTTPILCQQFGSIYCLFDEDTGELAAHMFIYKNGSEITRAYFMNGTEVIFEEIDTSGCEWTGNGSATDPFRTTAYINYRTGEPFENRDDCNVTVMKAGEVFYWHVHAQKKPPYISGGDSIFRFICRYDNRLVNSVSTNGTVQIYDMETELTEIGGLITLSVVDANDNSQIVTTAAVGQEIQLKLVFQPGSNNDLTELVPWGAYCERLYAETADGSLQHQLLDPSTLCPTSHPFLQPEGGMIGAADANGRFTGLLGVLTAGRFDRVKDSTVVVFVCEARLCWRPNDTDCMNGCAARTGSIRRKRELVRLLTTKLIIEDKKPDSESPGQSENSSGIPSYMWIVIGTASGILLIIMVAVVVCTLKRMRPGKYQHQRDSPPSSRTHSKHGSSRPMRY